MALSAAPAGAWSPPATVYSQTVTSPPAAGPPATTPVGTQQVILDDGSSIASWEVDPTSGPTQIFARVQNREGTVLGPDILVQTSLAGVEIQGLDVVALEDGAIFLWVEEYVLGGVEVNDLRYKVMTTAGVVGPSQQLDFASVPATDGFVRIDGLSTSSGGGFANVSWSLVDRRGPVASDCADTSSPPDGPCTFKEQARFARFNSSGVLTGTVTNLLSREFTAENTDCVSFSGGLVTTLLTAPNNGVATALISDYCRPQGGEAVPVLVFSRVSTNNQVSEPKIIEQFSQIPFLFFTSLTVENLASDISSDGEVTLSFGDGIFRISNGGKLSGPIQGAENLPTGWKIQNSLQVISLPGGRAIALMIGEQLSGSDLKQAAWSRVIEGDGSVGKPRQIYSRTLTPPAPGYPRSSEIYVYGDSGLGKDTGTALIDIRQTERQNSTSASVADSLIALRLNKNGERNGNAETLKEQTTSYSPATETVSPFFNYQFSEIDVAADGTASVLVQSATSKYQTLTPFPGSASFQLSSTKLIRNPNTCGVTPSLCKANVKVKGLKVSGRGAKTKLTITLKNSGNKDASKIKAKLTASGGAKAPKTVSFPKVLEGKTAKKTVKVSGSGTIKVKVGKSSKTIRF
ncbi:MAG: hypothetical protein ACKOFX_07735 [Solirubrobacterales bacterium]